MNKRNLILTLSLFVPFAVAAQSKRPHSDQDAQVTDVFKATFLSPGVSYEVATGKKTTFFANAFLSALAVTYTTADEDVTEYYAGPALSLEYRYYYNFKRRTDKDLRTEMNSLNFIAPIFNTRYTKIFKNGDPEFTHFVGAIWGMQRNYPKRFSLDIEVGPGYLIGNSVVFNKFTIFADLKLGFWLNKPKKD